MNNLSVIVSSTRPQRIGGQVADWVRQGVGAEWDTTLIDLAALDLPFLNEDLPAGSGVYTLPHTLAWKAMVDASDAIVIVNAEYNGFFTAPLKNAIDYLRAEWADKPIAIVGYGWGGAGRANTALTQLLNNLKANVIGEMGLFFNTDLTLEGDLTVTDAKADELRALSAKLAEAQTAVSEAA